MVRECCTSGEAQVAAPLLELANVTFGSCYVNVSLLFWFRVEVIMA